MSSYTYIKGYAKFLAGTIDLDSDDLRVKLVMTNTTADTDTTAEFLDEFGTLDEFDGVGYAEATLTGRSIVAGVLQADPTAFTHLSAGTRDIAGAVIYKFVTDETDSPVLAWVEFSYSPTGNTIKLTWVDGVFDTLLPTTFAENLVIPMDDTHANIPAGWTRATELDEKFPKGAATDGGGTGGAATHTHASTTHSHALASHTHTHAGTSAATATTQVVWSTGSGTSNPTAEHTHSIPTSGAATGSLDTGEATWEAASSLPEYYDVVFIKASGGQAMPASGLLWYDDDAVPTGFTQLAGAVSRFLRGAATSGDAGGTGGNADHVHAGTAHTHTSTHTHAAVSGAPSATQSLAAEDVSATPGAHTHAITATASATVSSSATSDDTGSTASLPAYHKLQVIKGAGTLLAGMYAIWLGTKATVPAGWVAANGDESITRDLRGLYLLATASGSADINGTGGANGHDHTDPGTHTHTFNHTHPVSMAAGASQITATDSTPGQNIPTSGHVHTASDYAASSPSVTAAAQVVDNNTDTQPPFLDVIFVRLTQPLAVQDPTITASAPALFKAGSFTKTIRKKKVG